MSLMARTAQLKTSNLMCVGTCNDVTPLPDIPRASDLLKYSQGYCSCGKAKLLCVIIEGRSLVLKD
jgi:hypothetical protein